MKPFSKSLLLPILLVWANLCFAQSGETPVKLFGYFQNSLQHWTTFEDREKQNSFSLQQLNLFVQKDINRNWTAFFNLEFLNNFSSNRQWGAANLDEAWVRYRSSNKFNLKLGLQIPEFNNLNVIKNRTPLLPYIIRPLVYETSFSAFIKIEEFVPPRAFVQVFGFLPSGGLKLDYAVYLGNSANVNGNRQRGQTGIDTTTTFLVGGRFGIRFRELKLGFSGTYEKKNDFIAAAELFDRKPSELEGVPKTRFGGDLSYNFAGFSFESEFINVNYHLSVPEMKLDLDFYYATLGYYLSEQLFVYSSYWIMDVHETVLAIEEKRATDEDVFTFNLGVFYDLNDRIRLKGQFARVKSDEIHNLISLDEIRTENDNFSVFALAVSVFF